MNALTRRTLLRATAATAALAAPAALAATIPATAPIDPLIALAKAERTAYRAWAQANTALDRAEGALMKTKSLPQLRGVMAGEYHCHSPEGVLSHCQPLDPDGPDAATGARLAEEMRSAIEDYRVERIAAGLGDLVAAEDAAGEVWEASRQKMADTPAQTFAGIAAKLRFVKEDMEIGDSEVAQEVLVSALADAERLAGVPSLAQGDA